MVRTRAFENLGKSYRYFLPVIFMLPLLAASVWAQVTASIVGKVKDASGAVVPGATVTAKHLESGLTRTAETDSNGSYSIPSLPIGQYELNTEKTGFKQEVRRGIELAVGQQAVLDLTLEVGNVEQQVTVSAEAPIVNTTLSSTSGLVGEKEVKDLPLNGRSFDQLLTLNAGTVNITSNTNPTARSGNSFSVAGRRQEETRFTINGMDYLGSFSSGIPYGPGGASGQLLGVDAVREFNVQTDSYGAEYGKRAGGQVSIVTSSGANAVHGSVFEFLRNSKLDARNFFDAGGVPPFKRNQFGGSLGGPIKKDKLFLFGNYEGFRQRLGISDVAVVPDAQARQGNLPCGTVYTTAADRAANCTDLNALIRVPNLKTGMLPYVNNFWPTPNGAELGGGTALSISNPPQAIREDFGLARFDYNVSAKDSFSATYLNDNGTSQVPLANPNFVSITYQLAQVLGFQETHAFSPTVLNLSGLGFSRADNKNGIPPSVAIPSNLEFISGTTPGTITIGGTSTGGSSIVVAQGQRFNRNVQNEFNGYDNLQVIKGRHSLGLGVWIERAQQDTHGPSSNNAGAVTYPSLTAFLQDSPSQIVANTLITPLGFRTTMSAWYVQDEIKLKPNLTLRMGLRDEMTTGWNEVTGRCANFIADQNGVLITNPIIGKSCLLQNNAIALWQPRVGLAWDPTGTGTWSVRAGFGIYNDLQDTVGSRLGSNPPFNQRVTFTTPLLSTVPLAVGPAPPACSPTQAQPCSTFAAGGLDPLMHTPTAQEWNLTVQREITKSLMIEIGYTGSEAYHEPIVIDLNTIKPVICSNPAGCTSGGINKTTGHVPQGATYVPVGTRPNSYLSNSNPWMFTGNSNYNAVHFSVVKRAAAGLIFKTNYTFSKALDLSSATNSTFSTNQPSSVLDPYNLSLNKGRAAFNIQQQFNGNFSYTLPFGAGQRWGTSATGVVNKLINGWQWNGIITAQSGFPFTPQVGSNQSGDGNTGAPDVPNHNPAFSGPVILGNVHQWFNPNAYLVPTSGTYGNVGRGSLTGPGLISFDTSLFKKIFINERWSLQFRAEAFNILNHANFGSPNSIVFAGGNISTSAGLITSTATTSRQLQFALKLVF